MAGGLLYFEASARLQRLFGRDLLPDEYAAVEELVKNAYDSNATEVTITIIRPSGKHGGEIEIRDNGWGLSLDGFRRVWMRAGYSEKTGTPLPVTGRIQAGEKGIGRFAADKLGERLAVTTKRRSPSHALKVVFDWRRFDTRRRLLSDIPVHYELTREPVLPKRRSGTILRIQQLRAAWDDKAIELLRARLARLLDPYDRQQGFQINILAPKPKFSGPVVPSQLNGADFEWEVKRSARGKVSVKRRTRNSLESPEHTWTDWELFAAPNERRLNESEEFGPITARFLYFVDRPKKSQTGDAAPGVAVYRDGLRVEPAGASTADWLGLVEKRAKRAGHMPLVPSRLFGFVQIGRETNPKLQDATNRRAFVTGPAFDAFTGFLKSRLREIEAQVEAEVAVPRWEKSRQVKSQKLIQARNKLVSVMSVSLAHELRQPLQAIQAASENVRGYLERGGVAIPEVTAAMDVIIRSVRRIDKHIQFLKNLGSGRENVEEIQVSDVIQEVVEGFREFAQARNITLIEPARNAISVNFNRSTLLETLTNLVLNACQAIEEVANSIQHTVRLEITDDRDTVKIRVDDDGPGIAEENRRRLFKRHTTSKQGGMGVGLIVWRDALRMFGGDLTCDSYANPTSFVVTVPKGVNGGQDTAR